MANRQQKKAAEAKNEMDELDRFDEKVYKATQAAEEQEHKRLQEEESMRIRAQSSLRGSFVGTSVGAVLGRNNLGNNISSTYSPPAGSLAGGSPYGNYNIRNQTKSIVGSRSPSRTRSMSIVGGKNGKGMTGAEMLNLDSSPHRYRNNNAPSNSNNEATTSTSTPITTASSLPKGAFVNPNTKISVPNSGDAADAKRLETGTYLSNLLAKLPLDEILKVYMLVVCGVGKRSEKATITMSPLTAASFAPPPLAAHSATNANDNDSSISKGPQNTAPMLSARQGSVYSTASGATGPRTAANAARASVRDDLNMNAAIATDASAVAATAADFGNGLGSSTFGGTASARIAKEESNGVSIVEGESPKPTTQPTLSPSARKRNMSMGAVSAKDDPSDAIQTQQELRKLGAAKNSGNGRLKEGKLVDGDEDDEEDEDDEPVGIPQLILDVAKARIALLSKEQKAAGFINVINSLQQAAIAGNLTAAVAAANNASHQQPNLNGTLSGTASGGGGGGGTTTIGGSTNSVVGAAGFSVPPINAPSMGFDLFYLLIKTCEHYQAKLQSFGKTQQQPILVNEVAAEVLELIDLDDQERDPLLVRVLSNINRTGSLSTSTQQTFSGNNNNNSKRNGNKVGIVSIVEQQQQQQKSNSSAAFGAAVGEHHDDGGDDDDEEEDPFGHILDDPPAHSDAYWAQIRKEQLEAERRETFEKNGFEGIATEALSVVKGFPSSNRFVRISDILTEIGRSRSSPVVQRRINFFVEMFLPRRQWPIIGPHNDAVTNMYFKFKDGNPTGASSAQHQMQMNSVAQGQNSSNSNNSNLLIPKAPAARNSKSPSSTNKPTSNSPASHNNNKSVTPKSPTLNSAAETTSQQRKLSGGPVGTPLQNVRPSTMVQIQNGSGGSGGAANNSVAGQQRRQTGQQVLSSVPANIFTAEFIIRFVADFLMPKQRVDESMRLHRRSSHAAVLSFFNNTNANTTNANGNGNTGSTLSSGGQQPLFIQSAATAGAMMPTTATSAQQQLTKNNSLTSPNTKSSEDDYYRELADNGLWSPSINSWLLLANTILAPLAELIRIKHEWFIERTYVQQKQAEATLIGGGGVGIGGGKAATSPNSKSAITAGTTSFSKKERRESTFQQQVVGTISLTKSPTREELIAEELQAEQALRNRYLLLLTTDARFCDCNPALRELLIRSVDPFESLLQCNISTLSSNHLSSSQQAQVTAANTQAAARVNAGGKSVQSAPGYMPASFLNPFQLSFEADHEQTLSSAKHRNIQQYLSMGDDGGASSVDNSNANAGKVPLLPVKTIGEDAAKAMCFAVPALLYFFESVASW
eukprot:GILI01011136.1.p1 GENE.GILI01011136.1~~GILI01011136.1.p1  ORF type:complete len:1498 (-),score=383.88 GILI01011136.1:113-4075(-)